MKLIVGLGNPGDKYRQTRHNIGFRVLDALQTHWEADDWKNSDKHEAYISETTLPVKGQEEKILLVKPQTYMNHSGKTVQSLIQFYKLDPSTDLLICFDDKDLLFGTLREKLESGSGGHNGIKSIIDRLGTRRFHRLKFGVGHEEQTIPTDAFVLQCFTEAEEKALPELIEESLKRIDQWLEELVTKAAPDV